MHSISDIESEQLVIGTLLSGWVDVSYWLSFITPACFSDVRCGAIYQAMQEILERGDQVNVIAVDDQIRLSNAHVKVELTEILLLSQNPRPENLQLLTYDSQRNRNVTQEQQMGYYSRTFKNLGNRLGILIIALSQLNRNMQHMRPSLMVIRDSGQIAEAADYVLFVWRPWVNHLQYDGNFVSYPTENTAMLIVAKNRQGPLAEILVGWRSLTTSFSDLTSEQLAALFSGNDPQEKKPSKAEAKAAAQAKAKQLQQTLFNET